MKDKFTIQHQAVADDLQSPKLVELQNRLDEILDQGMTAVTMRDVLFHKMLDVNQVPSDHFLRKSETPLRIDDPAIIIQLKQLGFSKKSSYQIH